MTAASTADAARLPLMLAELRLPTIARLWPDIAARADKEGWPAARLLATLAELELADRARRRIELHLAEARLPPGKTLATFDFTAVPTLSKAHVMALAAGTGWLERGANLLRLCTKAPAVGSTFRAKRLLRTVWARLSSRFAAPPR